jgi:lipopolysaccharide assembly protein A
MSVMRRVHRPQATPDGHPDVPRRTDGAGSTSRSRSLPRTRAGTAWILSCVGAVTGLALIIFIAQNVHTVDVSFLVWRGRFPLAVAMLAAALLGAVLTLVLGSTRIVQLRRTARRRGERAASPAPQAQSAPVAQPVPVTRTDTVVP